MSYFPSPDPQKLRNAFVQNHAFYTRTPPTPARSQPSPCTQSNPSNVVDQAYLSEPPHMAWHSDEVRGLGLVHIPSSTGSINHGLPSTTAESVSMSFPWPSGFPASQPGNDSADTIRKDSWTEGCDPMSTLLHSGSTWPQPQIIYPEYHGSPPRSEYSNSTQASCMSSPYAYSDSFQRAGASPVVKLEDADYTPQHMRFMAESVPFDQSMLVNPDDLVTHTPPVTNQAATAPVLHSNDNLLDEKPNLSAFRSLEYEVHSTDDNEDSLDPRTKRGFTKPETANCKCDQCGKLFQRSYNLKAHLETHDPHRSHPHTCEYIGCDKRFVRRTDLVRHEQSVHLKVRNFPCPLCDSSFARKDTLRRHIDDGCPKRPEVKKRMSKSRRSSATASLRRPSYQYLDGAPQALSPLRQPVQFA